MKLISIHPQKMLAVAANSPRYRLQTALNSQGMNDIPVDHPALPDDIRKTLKWATWEYLLVRNASPNTILFLIIMIGMGLYHQTLIWLLVGVCSVIALILALVGKLIDRPQWASQQLQSFLDTPFLFLVQETLYENLPQLRRLDADIQRLTRTKQEARHIQQQMALLTRQLKEKLILLGESTTDQQVVDLEVAQITQEKIISQAEQLLVECLRQRKSQEQTRTEVIQRLELQLLRQQAATITGKAAASEHLNVLTGLEMQALSLSTEMLQIQEELDTLNLKWQSMVRS